MSTDFKPGDRVHVEFDGEVTTINPRTNDGRIHVSVGQTYVAVVHPEHLTKYVEPVKAGDVLTDKDAEPPVGTIVLDSYENGKGKSAWHRAEDGDWHASGLQGWNPDSWQFVAGGPVGPATVLHLPDAE